VPTNTGNPAFAKATAGHAGNWRPATG